MIRQMSVTSRLTLLALCAFSLAALVGCGQTGGTIQQTGVQTYSTFTVTYANTQQVYADSTAAHTIPAYAGNSTGCWAFGGNFDSFGTPPPPDGVFWYYYGVSPKIGECYFSQFVRNVQWQVDYYSSQCQVVGAPYQVDPWVFFDGNGNSSAVNVCTFASYQAPTADSHFATTNLLPSTITVSSSGLSSTYGMPQLTVFDTSGNVQGGATATSVAADGSSATFPFPTNTSGGSLATGFYLFVVKNFTASNKFKFVDGTYFDLGSNVTLSTAFGVDAANTMVSSTNCQLVGNEWTCNDYGPNPTASLSIFTQYYSNQVSYQGNTIPVGTEPVAVKFYGTYTTETYRSGPTFQIWTDTTKPSNAIVVNSGSNSVSFVDLVNNVNIGNVAVGTQPMAVTLNSAATMAYVANYGSGTLSEVNLSTRAVTRTATVGAGAQSVTMDPGGSYVWVGGTNYLYKVSLSTFTVVASYPVSGSVTSLAASNAQNELVYTLVQNCCSGSSTYAANEVSLNDMSTKGNYAQATASPFAPYTMNGTLPSAAILPQATTVSAQFGNGMAASATPTGFVIYDLVSHHQIMTGTTPTPVRGIAADPASRSAYFTLPDSNKYIKVPLPQPVP